MSETVSKPEPIDAAELAKMLVQSIMEVRWPCTLDDMDKAIEFVRERIVHAYAIRGVTEDKLRPLRERDELIRLMADVLNWSKGGEMRNGWWQEMDEAIRTGKFPFENAPNLELKR